MLLRHLPILLRIGMRGTTEGKASNVPTHRDTAAGVGTTPIPLPAAGIPVGAPRVVLPDVGAGAGTVAIDTRPRDARGGRGAGAGLPHPVGLSNVTIPIRMTEMEPGFVFFFFHRLYIF